MAKTKHNGGYFSIGLRHANWLACGLAAIAIALSQTTPTEIVLHNFQAPPNGFYLNSGVVADSAGNLYGTAELGGKVNKGLVYKVDPRALRQFYTISLAPRGASPRQGWHWIRQATSMGRLARGRGEQGRRVQAGCNGAGDGAA